LMARWKAHVDFLLTVTELLPLTRYKAKVSKLTAFWTGWASLSQDFRGREEAIPREYFWFLEN